MNAETEAWLSTVRADLPPEALPLAASLTALAVSMDSEMQENGRVSGALASGYRQTHRALLEALKGAQGVSDPNEDDLFAPGAE